MATEVLSPRRVALPTLRKGRGGGTGIPHDPEEPDDRLPVQRLPGDLQSVQWDGVRREALPARAGRSAAARDMQRGTSSSHGS